MKRLLTILAFLLLASSAHADESMQLARMSGPMLGSGGGAATPPTYFGSSTHTSAMGGAITLTDSGSPITVTPPSSMVAGDLVLVYFFLRGNYASPTFTVSDDGGQSWTSETIHNDVTSTQLVWATFDGTWDASPQFSTNTTSAHTYLVTMHVFRPGSTPHTWSKDTNQVYAAYALPDSPYDVTISGFNTTHDNAVTIFTFVTNDDDTWTLQTAGVTSTNFDAGVYYIKNTGGNDYSLQTVYKVVATAGATGDVTSRIEGSPSAGGTIHKISFY